MYRISASDGPVKMNLTPGWARRSGSVRKWKIGSRKPQQTPKPTHQRRDRVDQADAQLLEVLEERHAVGTGSAHHAARSPVRLESAVGLPARPCALRPRHDRLGQGGAAVGRVGRGLRRRRRLGVSSVAGGSAVGVSDGCRLDGRRRLGLRAARRPPASRPAAASRPRPRPRASPEVVRRLAELGHHPADALADLRKLPGAEHDQGEDEDEDDFLSAERPEHGCVRILPRPVSLTGTP